MSRTKGTYTLTSNIEPKVGAPLDARTIVKLLADLTASNTFEYPYKGMKVFVEENNKSYTLVGSDPTVSTNWIEDNSGGHAIKNSTGTAMTQRSNLQFVDLTVSDDSTNDTTKVENIHVIQSESELDNLPDGLYMLDEDEDTVIDGNLVGYDNTDSELDAENVQDAIDEVVEALDDKIDISAKGVANGIAELDSTGKVPSSQLPSFVDDVLEYSSISAFPATGETGKIYVALDTNKTYRWGGTEYVEISESLALGETSSTAYRGDRGKIAYDHSQLTSGNPHNVTKSDIGLGNVDNTSDSTKKTNFTGSIASGNTGFVTGGDVYTALGCKADKVTNATNGNLAGLNGSGNLTDSGWNGAKDTTSISGNPISISGLKANQLAINPIITFEPIQDLHGQSKPYPAGGGKNKLNVADTTISAAGWVITSAVCSLTTGTYTFSFDFSGTSATGQVQFYTSGGTYVGDSTLQVANGRCYVTLTTTGACDLMRFYSNAIGTYKNFMVASGSDSVYAPYSNICPISGYDKIEVLSCGKNILPLTLNNIKVASSYSTPTGSWSGNVWDGNGITIEVQYDNDGNVSGLKANGTATANVVFYIAKDIKVLNETYTLGGCPSGGSAETYRLDARNMSTSIMVDTGNGVSFLSAKRNDGHVVLRIQSGTSVSNLVFKPQLEESATKTAFEPYHKTTDLSESLGQTVYKGSLDVRTGVLLGDMIKATITSISGTKPNYYASVSVYPDTTRNLDIVCDKMQTASSYGGSGVYINNNRAIMFVTSAYETAADLLAAFGGSVDVCYAVATSTEIQLTPHEISLLKDYAYVSTNGTNIALDYHNGELASLADVSQLGESVNELGDYVGIITDNNYVDCSACSTIYSIFETIMQGQSKLKSTAYGVGNIGALQNTNLKTLLGNPGLTNYVHAYIRPIVSGTNFMKLAEVYAVSTVNTQSAIKRKYIWMSQSSASQSAWETINYMT